MGGISAIISAAGNSMFKACLALDPVFICHQNNYKTIALKSTPLQYILTETWFDWTKTEYDGKTIFEGYFKECERIGNTNISEITTNDTTHIQ